MLGDKRGKAVLLQKLIKITATEKCLENCVLGHEPVERYLIYKLLFVKVNCIKVSIILNGLDLLHLGDLLQ